MKKTTIGLLIALSVGVLAVWLGALLYVPFFTSLLPDEERSDFGVTGDLFGAASSLFAGLGAFAVVVVLAFDLSERRKDLKHRQEEFRPFIAIDIATMDIAEAAWKNGVFHLVISAEILLDNATSMPALNVTMTSELVTQGGKVGGNVTLSDAPLSSGKLPEGQNRKAEVQYSSSGAEALSIFRQFETSTGFATAPVNVRYTSLNGVAWNSSVTYRIACTRTPDQDIVRQVGAVGSDEVIGSIPNLPGAENIVVLATTPENGSWTQGRVD